MNYIAFDGKIRIVFVFQVASFWPSWESLYKSCIEDERFTIKLMWIDDITGDVAQMSPSKQFLEHENIPYEIFNYDSIMSFQPHYMIYQTPYDKGHRKCATWTARFRRQGIRIVYIPYGIEISDTMESRYKHFSMAVVRNAFNIYVLSPIMKAEYEKFCVNSEAVRALGLPRFDNLKEKERFALEDKLTEKIGGRKIILWKTHFPKIFEEKGVKKQATPQLEEYIKFAEYIKHKTDLFFIFMPHPKFTDDTIDASLRPMAIELLQKLREMENVYIDQSADYRYSLMNADAIIVDRSAVMVEAGAIGVPVLYMYNADYNEPMTKPIANLLNSYYSGTTANEMIEFTNSCQAGQDIKREAREQAFEKCVPFFDGKCAERIKDNLYQEAKISRKNEMVEEFHNNEKIIIFGTGNIAGLTIEAWNEKHDGQRMADVIAFVDNDIKKQGKEYKGKRIITPKQITETEYDYIVIATDLYFREIYLQLINELKVSKEKILTYDQFIVLVSFQDKMKSNSRG